MMQGQRGEDTDKFHSMSMARMTAAICILCLLLAACGMSTQEQWQEQYDLGQQYLLDGDYEQAIVAFTAAIEIDPNVADAYLGRAEAYYELAQEEMNATLSEEEPNDLPEATAEYLNAALEDYLTVLELGDTSESTYLDAVQICITLGEYDQAAELLEAGAQANPDSAEIEQMSAELADLIEERAQQELVEAQRLELEETYWDLLMQVVDLLEEGPDAIGSSDWFSDDYRAFCAELTTEVIWELDNGLYLGVYPEGYVYYGEMEEGQRSGYGSWFYCYSSSDEAEGMYKDNYYIPPSTVYEGEWASDAPNGWGTLADWYQIVNVSTQDYEFDSYELNFVDGVGDGAGTMVYMFHSTGAYYYMPYGESIPEGEYYEECDISVVNGELQEIHQFGTGGPYAAVFDNLWNDTYYFYAVIKSDYRVVRVSGL